MRYVLFTEANTLFTKLRGFVSCASMIESVNSAKDLLQHELTVRQKKNSAYSMRSFAKTLGVSPSYLSLVFKGERRLTQAKAQSFGRKLSWPIARRRYMTVLTEFETCKSESDKKHLLTELEKLSQLSRQVPSLDVDRFASISEWHHSAILALLTLPELKKTSENIAKRLNILPSDCDVALGRLLRLGLISQDQNKCWIPTHENLYVEGIPSKAIRIYHKEVLRKAMVAIEMQSFEERDFSNWIFTVDPKRLAEAKQKIREFQNEMCQLVEGTSPSQLYQFSVQLFRVDADTKNEKEN